MPDRISYKYSHHSTTVVTQEPSYQTKAIEVENELRNELRNAFFAETPRFLDTFFPVSDNKITEIYNALGDFMWSGFPDSSDEHRQERAYCQRFVDLANAIHAACGNDAHSNLRWSSAPTRYPTTYDTKAADLQPDIVAALGVTDVPMATSVKSLKQTKVPRHQILVPMEVKKDSMGVAAPMQLFKYIRQVFRDTVDRRFVFGLVLANRDITIYLADRSGILGSTSFDMHDVRLYFPLFTSLPYRIFLHRIIAR